MVSFFLNQCTTQHKLHLYHYLCTHASDYQFSEITESVNAIPFYALCMFKLQPFQQNLIPTFNQRRMKFTCEQSHCFYKVRYPGTRGRVSVAIRFKGGQTMRVHISLPRSINTFRRLENCYGTSRHIKKRSKIFNGHPTLRKILHLFSLQRQ